MWVILYIPLHLEHRSWRNAFLVSRYRKLRPWETKTTKNKSNSNNIYNKTKSFIIIYIVSYLLQLSVPCTCNCSISFFVAEYTPFVFNQISCRGTRCQVLFWISVLYSSSTTCRQYSSSWDSKSVLGSPANVSLPYLTIPSLYLFGLLDTFFSTECVLHPLE
jgi:hypothetical protein